MADDSKNKTIKKKNFNKTFKSAVEAEKFNEEKFNKAFKNTLGVMKGVGKKRDKSLSDKLSESIIEEIQSELKMSKEQAEHLDWEAAVEASEIKIKKGDGKKEWKVYFDKPNKVVSPGVAGLSEVKFVMPTEVAQILLDAQFNDEGIFNKLNQLGISFVGINPVNAVEYAPIKYDPFAEEDKKNWGSPAPASYPAWHPAPVESNWIDESEVRGNAHDEIKQKAIDALQKQASKEFNNNDLDKEIKKSFEAVEDLINFMPMPQGVIPDIYTSSPKIEAEAKAKESLWDSNEWMNIEAEAKKIIDKIGSDKPEWRYAQLDKLASMKDASEESEDSEFLKVLGEIGEDDDKFTTGFSSIDKAIKEGSVANGDNFLIGSAPKATQKQLNYLKKLGWNGDVPSTQSEASKLITKLVGKDNGPGPTLKQLNYLGKLGYTGDAPETKKEASALIDSVKMSKNIRREDRFYPE